MKKTKYLICGLIIGLLLTTGVFASNEQIQARFAEFKLSINGEQQTLNTKPLIHNGTSYLPVREVADLLGYDVDFDKNSNTIILDNQIPKTSQSENGAVNVGDEFALDNDTKIKVTSVEYQDEFDNSQSQDGEIFVVVYYDILTSLKPSDDYYWNPFSFVGGFTMSDGLRVKMSSPANTEKIKTDTASSSLVYTNVPIAENPTSIVFKSPNSNKLVEVKLK